VGRALWETLVPKLRALVAITMLGCAISISMESAFGETYAKWHIRREGQKSTQADAR
jgi:hypothetical protein